MAEAILLQQIKNKNDLVHVSVKSAGLYTADGIKTSAGTQYALGAHDISFDGESTQLTKELFEWADLVLTMTESHREALISLNPKRVEKVYTLKDYVYEDLHPSEKDISDPFGQDERIYLNTFDEINQAINELIKQINS